jgi:flagellar hook assembly protein FlgD
MSRWNLAGPASAALLLVCALTVQATGGVISDVGVIPSPFSPNADGVFDSTAVYYSLSVQAAVVVSVRDSTGGEPWMLWSGWEGAGTHSHWWNGRLDGLQAPDGEYRFLIEAIPETGPFDEAGFSFTIDTVAPLVYAVDVAPSLFSPDGDGVGDSLMIVFETSATEPSDQVLVTVLGADDEPVRQVYSASGVASGTVFWNGRDDSGEVADDGLHYVVVEGRDAAGNRSESGALVDLDTAPPRLGVDYPDTALTEIRVSSTVAEVTGWASDRAGVVGVEMSIDSENWSSIEVGRPDSVSWAASVACADCIPDSLDETLEVFIRAHDGTPTADGEGHVNGPSSSVPVLSFDVVFDVAPPVHESSTVGGGHDTFESGASISITTRWDDAGYAVSADFSRLDSEFDPANVEVTESATTAGRYSIIYTLSESNTFVPVTDAPVIITATDHFERSTSDSTVTLSVVPASTEGPTAYGVSANSFRPLLGEDVVIALGSYDGAVTVSVYNMSGTLVRTIESDAGVPVHWYGENDEGESVASGVYFLRIQAAGSESVRKVAVIR